MTYRFDLQEPIARGVSRIGLEQIDIAEAGLARRADIATGIHDCRRSLKRLRALLRLIRPALADRIYRREMRRIAGIGRLLAGARDTHVMQLTLAKLEGRPDGLSKAVSGRVAKLMANGPGPGTGPGTGPAAGARRALAQERRQALEGLEQARAFFARAKTADIEFEHVAEGLERSYRKARKAFHEAYRSPSDEAFHDYRKRVQQHWRHMQLLSRGWPDVLSGRASEAKELSRLLGDDHDFAVLAAFAKKRGPAVLSAHERTSLLELCRKCQSELRILAKPRGLRLLAEPADDLSERIALYWSAAEHLSALVPPRGAKPDRRAPKQAPRQTPRRRAPAAAAGAQAAASRSTPEPKLRRERRAGP